MRGQAQAFQMTLTFYLITSQTNFFGTFFLVNETEMEPKKAKINIRVKKFRTNILDNNFCFAASRLFEVTKIGKDPKKNNRRRKKLTKAKKSRNSKKNSEETKIQKFRIRKF